MHRSAIAAFLSPPVQPDTATGWDLHAIQPATLPIEEIRAIDKPNRSIHEHRTCLFNDGDFELSPGIFLPGEASRLAHPRLLDRTLPVTSLRCAAMRARLGVDAMVAAARGTSEVSAPDIYPESGRTTERHCEEVAGPDGPPPAPPVIDRWESLPEDEQLDLVTFTPRPSNSRCPTIRQTSKAS